jgi:prevent-host-death family protein
MVTTLRESKAKLSELVERASRGEDVLITVRGTVKARLTKVEASPAGFDGRAWVGELRTLQEATKRRKSRSWPSNAFSPSIVRTGSEP